MSRSCSKLFLRQSVLNSRVSFWWKFAEQLESCHTDPRVQTVTYRHPIVIDGRLLASWRNLVLCSRAA